MRRRLCIAALAAALVAATAYGVGLQNRLTVSRPSFDHQGISVLDLDAFSAAGVVHMKMRVTTGLDTRGNGQENLWASTAWTESGVADPAGTLEDGSATTQGVTPETTLRRMAKWDRSGLDDRLIFNAVSGGDIGGLFDTGDPYLMTIVRIIDGQAQMISLDAPRAGGNQSYVDWQRDASTNALTSDEWNFIDGMVAGQSVIIAIHQGAASYN